MAFRLTVCRRPRLRHRLSLLLYVVELNFTKDHGRDAEGVDGSREWGGGTPKPPNQLELAVWGSDVNV